MRRFVAIATALACLLPSSMIGAQIAPGESGHSSESYFGGDEAWSTLHEFGVCFAWTQRTVALDFVATKPDSIEELEAYKKIFKKQQNCLSLASELRVPYQMVRGAIAEGLYIKGIPVPPSLAVTQAPTVDKVRNFMDASLCYAAAHRAEVRDLLATTKLGTKREDAAVSKILANFGSCIPAGARSILIDSPMIRLRLAEAMWRLGETGGGHA